MNTRSIFLFLLIVGLLAVQVGSAVAETSNVSNPFQQTYSDDAFFLQSVQEESSDNITMKDGVMSIVDGGFVRSYDAFNFTVDGSEITWKMNGTTNGWLFLSHNSSLITSPYFILDKSYIRYGVSSGTIYLQSTDGGNLATSSASGIEWYKINVSGTSTNFYKSIDGNTWDLVKSQTTISPTLDNIYLYFSGSGGVFSEFEAKLSHQNTISVSRHRYDNWWTITPTIDDGGKGDLIAEMLMKKESIAGTSWIIVNSAQYSSSSLSEFDIVDMFNSGTFDIGSHTWNHKHLIDDPTVNATVEIYDANTYISNLIGTDYVPLAYPYGAANYSSDVLAVHHFGRLTTPNSTYPFATDMLDEFGGGTDGFSGYENSRFAAYQIGGHYKPFDHSGGIYTGEGNSYEISGRDGWGSADLFFSQLKNVYSRTGTTSSMREIVEYQELAKTAEVSNQNYNAGVLSFDISSNSSSWYTTPLTVRANINSNMEITVNENLDIRVNGARTRFHIIDDGADGTIWFEVSPGTHSITIQNGSSSYLFNDILSINSVSADTNSISWTTDNPADSIVYYTNNTSAAIHDWSSWGILTRNTTRTSTHSVSVPSIDYMGRQVPSNFSYIVASTNENRVSAWDDNGDSYYVFDVEGSEDTEFIITDSSPTGTTPTITEGQSQTFSVTVNNESQINWYVNTVLTEAGGGLLTDDFPYGAGQDAGEYNVTVTCNDGVDTVSQTWTLTITEESVPVAPSESNAPVDSAETAIGLIAVLLVVVIAAAILAAIYGISTGAVEPEIAVAAVGTMIIVGVLGFIAITVLSRLATNLGLG